MLLLQTLTVEHIKFVRHDLAVFVELFADRFVPKLEVFQINFGVTFLDCLLFAIVLKFFAQRFVIRF